MEFTAVSKSIRISPRKVRMVVNAVKKLTPIVAIEKLRYLAKSSSLPVLKALKSAIANSKLKIEDLRIKNILVDEGMRMKRRDTSHRPGKEGLIQKRTSHIKVILTNGQ